MKNSFMLLFITLLFANTFSITPSSASKELIVERNRAEHTTETISPMGLWFTEDNEHT
ncbi:MAG: hypothetical protein R6U02_00675 [Alkalibacterium sp.]|uniref:hypothetical protein n=1 Tax=Alkalibacterium sp. TaxID=1872447 RepID=UPI003970C701